MRAYRNGDGTLTVPRRAVSDDGVIGDGYVTIGPGDSEFAEWRQYLDSIDDRARQEQSIAGAVI